MDYDLIISTTDQFMSYFNSYKQGTEEFNEMFLQLKNFLIVGDEIHKLTNDAIFREKIVDFIWFVRKYSTEFIFHFFTATLSHNSLLPILDISVDNVYT
jgi:hypothetical protein